MKKKYKFLVFLILLMGYPLYSVFQLEAGLEDGADFSTAQNRLKSFQVSIWLCWVIMVAIAIYDKWTRKSNFFFNFTYGFLVLSFVNFGIFTQLVVTEYKIPSNFSDGYTLAVFTAIQHLLVGGALTGFLHAAVWWFTRRWHRR